MVSLGQALFDAGEYESSESVFSETVKIAPSLGSAYHGLGLSLYKTARLEEALEAIEKALKLEPGSARYPST